MSLQAQQVVASIDNTTVLGGLNCSVQAGQVLGVVGPNGAGKSTLMRVLAGLLEPDSGSVLIDDQDIAGLPRRARARRIAYLPQQGEIHWPISGANVVALGRYPHDEPGAGRGGTLQIRRGEKLPSQLRWRVGGPLQRFPPGQFLCSHLKAPVHSTL